MRTETIQIYSFSELIPAAQATAINNYRDYANETFDPSMTSEVIKSHLEDQGYPTENVYWQLNYCQGDYVQFTGPYTNIEKVLTKLLGEAKINELKCRDDWDETKAIDVVSIGRNGMTLHHPGCGPYGDGPPDPLLLEVEEALRNDLPNAEVAARQIGYEDIEFRTSDEYLKEEIEANEWEFRADGNRWDG